MLALHAVHTFYGPIEALKGVSVNVDQGEIVTLIGANGAGKSTLLMTACGDLKPKFGTVEFMGQDISQMPTHKVIMRGMAVVPEGRRVFSALTVAENLQMGGYHQDNAKVEEDLSYVLGLFPRLKERYAQRAGTLSGGEQQMLAIGRALMSRPKLLLLDEPSLGLAPIIIGQIFDIIQQIREQGTTIFLVEQNANRALTIADRGYVLENGKVVLSDSGNALLSNDEVKKAYLGG